MKGKEERSSPSEIKSITAEVAAGLVANLCMVNSGMVLGFPSAALPPLLKAGASIDQASWVAGLVYVTAPVASVAAGALVDRFGRRKALAALNLPFAAGWLLGANFLSPPLVASWPCSFAALAAGRLASGLGVGLGACTATSYAAEAATASRRAPIAVMAPVMMAVGTFVVYTFAMVYQHSYVEVAWLGSALSAATWLLTIWLPESPRWLAARGRQAEAGRALALLRGGVAPAAELDELEALSAAMKGAEGQSTAGVCSRSPGLLERLCRPGVYKPFIVMNAFFLAQNMSGVGIVIVFAVDIGRAAGVEAGAHGVALAIAVERLLAALLTVWASARLGRRRTALASGLLAACSLLALTASLALFARPWPALTAPLLLAYVLASSVGFSALPWAMLGEIFPTDVRGIASGVTAAIVYLEAFCGAKLYPGLVLAFGPVYVFLFFGMSAVLGTIFMYLFLPETRGKTLFEIERYFENI